MLGWAGFTSSVQAYLAVVDATDTEIKDVVARDDFKHLRWLNTMDLLLEHVPQLCLQAFVGIAHGDLVRGIDYQGLPPECPKDRLG